jgi:hypothetical protein
MVYQAVNKSVNGRIEMLGEASGAFTGPLALLWANRAANDKCLANTKLPCSPEGKHQEDNAFLQQDVAWRIQMPRSSRKGLGRNECLSGASK